MVFENQRDSAVSLLWVDFDGKRQPFGHLQPNETRLQETYSAHSWIVTDGDGNDLGHFIAGPQQARAIIPSSHSRDQNPR